MAGAELGFGPVASMRGIDIIKGEVTLAAGLVAALVRRSPEYDYEIRQWDNQGCEIVFTRNGRELTPSSKFTAEDARTARLGGDNYQKFPRNMFFARAMTNGARIDCPDLFAGAVYTAEELAPEVEAAANGADSEEQIVAQVKEAFDAKELEPAPARRPRRRRRWRWCRSSSRPSRSRNRWWWRSRRRGGRHQPGRAGHRGGGREDARVPDAGRRRRRRCGGCT